MGKVRRYPEVILVEGLFDYAVLWQAGFHNVTCSMGAHLNTHQFRQLCDGTRTVYLTFDADPNGSGDVTALDLMAVRAHLRSVLPPEPAVAVGDHWLNGTGLGNGSSPQRTAALRRGVLKAPPDRATQ